jgi:hypothetical protein
MKKFTLFTAPFLAAVIFAFSYSGYNELTLKNNSGSQAGYAGDPAGGNNNCTSCHIGSPAQMQTGWITSDIPVSGYIPETTYSITATATGASVNKFGFQVSPQNAGGTFLGTLINTGSQTQLSSNQKYITHTSSGTSGSGSKSWTFNWTAPDAASGPVTFYGAFNLANGNSNATGDVIMLSTLTVTEDLSVSTNNYYSNSNTIIYPNPAAEKLYIQTGQSKHDLSYSISDLAGKELLNGYITNPIQMIDISSLPSGIFIISFRDDSMQPIKFIK